MFISSVDEQNQKINKFKVNQCTKKLKKLMHISDEIDEYRIPFEVSEANLDEFFRILEFDFIPNINITNICDFYNLSREFSFTQFEQPIKEYMLSHPLSYEDFRRFSQDKTLNHLFFDEYISYQIDSILEKNPNYLDMISSFHLYHLLAKSGFSKMSELCRYILHRYQLPSNSHDIELNICLFSFIDCSTLSDDLVKSLIPVSFLHKIYIPNLDSRIRQVLPQPKVLVRQSNLNEQNDSLIKQFELFKQMHADQKEFSQELESFEKEILAVNNLIEFYNLHSFKHLTKPLDYGCHHITSLTIPANVVSIEESLFSLYSCVSIISVDSNNLHFACVDNVLFSKNLDRLIWFPPFLSDIEYEIPSSVTSIGNYAFYGCHLKGITIPESVTSIGDYAFFHSDCLTSIKIHSNVAYIGVSAFGKSFSLRSIDVESDNQYFYSVDGVLFARDAKTVLCCPIKESISLLPGIESIGPYAYSNYRGEVIEIPSSVKSIGDFAFESCHNVSYFKVEPDNQQFTTIDGVLFTKDLRTLICFPSNDYRTDYTIPSTVTSIAIGAFSQCDQLASIIIPQGVGSIDDFVFSQCLNLQAITIPSSVTSIGRSSFAYCSNLLSIAIPPNLKSIGQNAFEHCSKLQSIILPQHFESIGELAFLNCSHLQSISIPNTIKSIGELAFADCYELQLTLRNHSHLSRYNLIDGVLFDNQFQIILFFPATNLNTEYKIPDTVRKISMGTFSHCQNLQSITIPPTITSIDNFTFFQCTNLQSITIPKTVVSINYRAFSDCPSLKTIAIHANINSIDTSAFSFCSNLTAINVELDNPNFTSIDGVLFSKDCKTLLYFPENHSCSPYYIPEGTTTINQQAFAHNKKIQSIAIPDITSINNGPLNNYYHYQSIIIHPNVTSIGDEAFYHCDNLQSVILPSRLTSINTGVFRNCTNLHSIIIPTSVTIIGDGAFSGCTCLQSIPIPSRVKTIGKGAFSSCNSLQSIVIPTSVTIIGDGAFSGCTGLQSISIPPSVTSIGNPLFFFCCNLHSVTVPQKFRNHAMDIFPICFELTFISND